MRFIVTVSSHLAGFTLLFLGLLPAPVTGQQEQPNFNGKWQLNSSRSALQSGKPVVASLIIEQKPSSIHIVSTMNDGGKQGAGDITCTTDGKECEVGGHKLSFWYSGASLVEMEIGKDVVMKSTIKLDADGKSLTIDVVHVTPTAETDKLVLEKN